MCNCGNGAETTIHYFIYCAKFNLERKSLFDNVRNVDETLLFGKQNSENSVNKARLNLTIEYILSSKRFNCPLRCSNAVANIKTNMCVHGFSIILFSKSARYI